MPLITAWHGHPMSTAPNGDRFLVADDNDRYARALIDDLASRGGVAVRVHSAREGIARLAAETGRFDGIITDIDMETQLSGLRLVRYANRQRFPGWLVVTTTGLDNRLAFRWNRWLFKHGMPVDYLIPKRPVRRDHVVLWLATGAKRRARPK